VVLLIDALAVLVVAASGPAAYMWLDQSRPSPLATAPQGEVGPTSSLNASPVAVGSPQPDSTPTVSPTPTPKLIFGEGTWAPAESLPQAVWASASAPLRGGRVLSAGGAAGPSSFDAVATASVFDPATGHWSRVTDMLQPRAYAMAVTLADGTVLVAGGSRNGQPLDTAERYFPDAGTWVAAGRLNLPRSQGTLTLLADGRVLATGGGIEGDPSWSATASAEIFDPTTGQWQLVAPMAVARARHTATLLADGEVLVVGGAATFHGETGSVTASAEIYNAKSNSWRSAGFMSKPRYVQGAALLNDGRVLVAGGWYSTSNGDPAHNTAEIYDPATGKWTATGSMTNGRAEFGLVSLPDGRVLAAGGVDPSYVPQAGAELFDPSTGIWTATGSLKVATMWPAMQVLPDGRVLIAGGGLSATADRVTAVCEIYTPVAG
jgi:N-acetylneuraminic acid mutarotase